MADEVTNLIKMLDEYAKIFIKIIDIILSEMSIVYQLDVKLNLKIIINIFLLNIWNSIDLFLKSLNGILILIEFLIQTIVLRCLSL